MATATCTMQTHTRTCIRLWTIFASVLVFELTKRADARERRPLVLISLDGCRWDYLDRANFPALAAFRQEAAAANWVQGTFPTKTYPSHNTIVTGKHSSWNRQTVKALTVITNSLFSLATGRYSENHGIIGNGMFDLDTGKIFRVGPQSLDPYFWDYNSTQPIWVSSVRQNIKSGVYFWPGSEVRFKHYISWVFCICNPHELLVRVCCMYKYMLYVVVPSP